MTSILNKNLMSALTQQKIKQFEMDYDGYIQQAAQQWTCRATTSNYQYIMQYIMHSGFVSAFPLAVLVQAKKTPVGIIPVEG